MNEQIRVPKEVAETICAIAQLGPEGVKAKRVATLQYLEDRGKKLQAEEDRLHNRLNPAVESVVSSIQILHLLCL